MSKIFDLGSFIDGCRKVQGAITIQNAMSLVDIGEEVFILLNTEKNVAVIKGEVLFIQHHTSAAGEPDIKITLEFKKAEMETGLKKKHVSVVVLGEMLNGRSEFIGDEANSNYSRMFYQEQDSIDYFEIVRYVRQCSTLERASDVSALVSRLLKNPPPVPPEE